MIAIQSLVTGFLATRNFFQTIDPRSAKYPFHLVRPTMTCLIQLHLVVTRITRSFMACPCAFVFSAIQQFLTLLVTAKLCRAYQTLLFLSTEAVDGVIDVTRLALSVMTFAFTFVRSAIENLVTFLATGKRVLVKHFAAYVLLFCSFTVAFEGALFATRRTVSRMTNLLAGVLTNLVDFAIADFATAVRNAKLMVFRIANFTTETRVFWSLFEVNVVAMRT